MKILYKIQFWSFFIGLLFVLWYLGGKYTIIGKTFYFEDWYYDPVIHECIEKDTVYVETDLGGYQENQKMIEIGDCVRWKDMKTGEIYTRADVNANLSRKLRPVLMIGGGFIVLWGFLLGVSILLKLFRRNKG